ncbi:hypothetical protein I7I50_01393 [Histoplasma capsulatum G186AR]|uniref:Uncharacterized protein n=1 Tax=Ajellomyces capsulatus TaxID=5037 RepID=A0A8H7YD58_AJECA|nr:hypothetical protein I7I52_12509 [Histoplasma capsulatum]QSS73284.1 hypothetical protein I7I50_01393 [Histoplasma capsulatum G186AR]
MSISTSSSSSSSCSSPLSPRSSSVSARSGSPPMGKLCRRGCPSFAGNISARGFRAGTGGSKLGWRWGRSFDGVEAEAPSSLGKAEWPLTPRRRPWRGIGDGELVTDTRSSGVIWKLRKKFPAVYKCGVQRRFYCGELARG